MGGDWKGIFLRTQWAQERQGGHKDPRSQPVHRRVLLYGTRDLQETFSVTDIRLHFHRLNSSNNKNGSRVAFSLKPTAGTTTAPVSRGQALTASPAIPAETKPRDSQGSPDLFPKHNLPPLRLPVGLNRDLCK